jgi:hypothetical protein
MHSSVLSTVVWVAYLGLVVVLAFAAVIASKSSRGRRRSTFCGCCGFAREVLTR